MVKTYLKERKLIIDEHVKTLLHSDKKEFDLLFNAMNYSLLDGGKRIRPILMMATVEALGNSSRDYLDIACSIECIHTYSLIHDDLPAMDDDKYRRGKLTNHSVYGDGLAVLAGDGLLTYAFELIGRQQINPELLCSIMYILAKAAGPYGMVGGQAFDLASEGKKITLDELKVMHKAKTGEMFKAAIAIGGILGGATAEQQKALLSYADFLGLTFQITDDILDVIGNEKMLGKPVGSDEKNHKATYVTILSLVEAQRLAQEAANQAVDAIQCFDGRADILREIVRYLLVRAV